MDVLVTERLELLPITRALVDAVVEGRRADAEDLCRARFPEIWPGRALVERAFACPLDKLREDPDAWLWGARVLVARGGMRQVVGSVVLDGQPDPRTQSVEVAYGIDGAWQGQGFATEGTRAVVEWALAQRAVSRVTASTFPWHSASLRVLRKIGMQEIGTRETEMFGELVVYARSS